MRRHLVRARPCPSEADRLRAEIARLKGALSEAEIERDSLRALVHEDPLTGLLNRRGFLRDLDRAISYGARYGTPAALLMVDLDRFKPINDTYGHDAGDAALRHVGDLLRGHLRASDSCARLGGDEFAVLLWQVDGELAVQKALALEAVLEAHPLAWNLITLAITGSIGAAALAGQDDAATALARVDRAMYARKSERRAGRPGLCR